MGRTLLEQGDNITIPGFTLPGTGSLAITFDDTGTSGLTLDFLVLSGTPSVSIASTGAGGGFNRLNQLIETDHNLTKVTISGSESFILGSATGDSTGDGVVTDILVLPKSSTTIHSSLKLIDASAATGDLEISAGATNMIVSKLNTTITYTGLVIKGGRAAISSRMTLRTVSSETAMAAPTRSSWAEPVRRPSWAPVATIMFSLALASSGPMRRRVAPSAIR